MAPAVFTKIYQLLLDRGNIDALLSNYIDNIGIISKEGWREAKLLPNAPGLLHQYLENSGIQGIAHYQGPYVHLWNLLAIPIDPAVPLLQAVGIPGQLIMNHDVGHVLEIDSFADAVGGDEDAFLESLELIESLFSLHLVELAINGHYPYVGLRLWKPLRNLSFQIVQSVLIASEYDYLGRPIISGYGLAEEILGQLPELAVLGGRDFFG